MILIVFYYEHLYSSRFIMGPGFRLLSAHKMETNVSLFPGGANLLSAFGLPHSLITLKELH